MTPIDLATNTAGTPITGGGLDQPQSIAITPNGQTAYVGNNVGSSVTPIDLTTNGGDTITGGGLYGTSGAIAITPDGSTAYVLSSNGIVPSTSRLAPLAP